MMFIKLKIMEKLVILGIFIVIYDDKIFGIWFMIFIEL